MATKNPQNDAVLAIRINQELLNQLNALAKTKAIGASSLVRMLVAEYIRSEAPKALLGATPQPQAKGKPLQDWEKAMSPAQRKKMEDDYDEAWG